MSDIVVTTQGLESVIGRFRAVPGQIAAAKKRALAKTVKSIGASAAKDMAASVGVAQKAIKRRIATRTTASTGLVWFGLKRIDAQLAGKASQNKRGARAGRHDFPGAFVKAIYTAEQKIWIRLASRQYDPEIYPYKKRAVSYGELPAGLSGRFPVVKATLAIDTPATRAVIAAQAKRAQALLAEKLGQELNYEVNVKGAR